MTLIEQMLDKRGWTSEADDPIRHFLAAGRVLIENRNLLMHSVVVHGGDEKSHLYRTSRKGEPLMLQDRGTDLPDCRDLSDLF